MQKVLYDDFAASKDRPTANDVNNPDDKEGKGQPHIFQALQYLRKLCNHPALVLKTPDAVEAALDRAGKGSTLNDIQNAPKLLALRYISICNYPMANLLIVQTTSN